MGALQLLVYLLIIGILVLILLSVVNMVYVIYIIKSDNNRRKSDIIDKNGTPETDRAERN